MDSLKNSSFLIGCRLMFGLWLASAPVSAAEGEPHHADYFDAMRQELARLNVGAQCNDAARSCSFTSTVEGIGDIRVSARHHPASDTIYIFIDNFIEVASADGPDRELALRLLSLNHRMVTAKFEWDDTTNTVRLSTVMNTDSNFDRRAFRSQIKGVINLSRQLLPEFGENPPQQN